MSVAQSRTLGEIENKKIKLLHNQVFVALMEVQCFCSESKEIELPEVIKQKFDLIKPIFKTVSVRWIHGLSNLLDYFGQFILIIQTIREAEWKNFFDLL